MIVIIEDFYGRNLTDSDIPAATFLNSEKRLYHIESFDAFIKAWKGSTLIHYREHETPTIFVATNAAGIPQLTNFPQR